MSIGFDTGTTTAPGATRQRWRSKSASALIRELLSSCGGDPLDKACRDQVTEQFTYLLLNDEAVRTEYLPSVAEYFAANALNALARNETSRRKRRSVGLQPDAGPEAEPRETAPVEPEAATAVPETAPAPEALAQEATPAQATAAEPSSEPAAPVAPEPTLAERAAEAAARQTAQQREARASAREDIKRTMRVKFLELLMPNGKALGNCTGAECRGFGS
jgi:hypothetical protein